MNTKNNKRSSDTIERIESALVFLLRDKELLEISVAEICKIAEIDRSTFYAHFKDTKDLANSLSEKLERKIQQIPHTKGDFSWIFEYVKANPETFKIYFKLGVSKIGDDYKSVYFRNGVYAVVKMWFNNGCVEKSDEMGKVILKEYKKIT